jgi:hypothetical protein
VSEMIGTLFGPSVLRGASIDGEHRYHLFRAWKAGGRSVAWVMLNPSTADAENDDPTVRRCMDFARRWGFGSIDVLNLYTYRTPSPAELKRAGYPNGPHADATIRRVLGEYVDIVVCAWGTHARPDRVAEVLGLIREAGHGPKALRITQAGYPMHPSARGRSRIPPTTRPIAFGGAT